jgi:hypothetical protein
MSDINVVLVKKNGNSNIQMFPATNDDRVAVTSDSSKLPSEITTLKDLINALGSLAFEDYVALNVSSEDNYGVVKITNADSEATDVVPSAKLVHDELGGKVSTTGNESIAGVKTFSDGIKVGTQNVSYDQLTDTITYGAPITPPSNP